MPKVLPLVLSEPLLLLTGMVAVSIAVAGSCARFPSPANGGSCTAGARLSLAFPFFGRFVFITGITLWAIPPFLAMLLGKMLFFASAAAAPAVTGFAAPSSTLRRLLALLSPDEVEAQPMLPDAALSTGATATAPAPAPRPTSTPSAPEPKKKPAPKRKAEVLAEPIVTPDVPLTREEQELLTETINDLPAEHLGGVIQIIREAAPVGADEDEIDLDIDQLSPTTQRKLLRHVSKVSNRSHCIEFGLDERDDCIVVTWVYCPFA